MQRSSLQTLLLLQLTSYGVGIYHHDIYDCVSLLYSHDKKYRKTIFRFSHRRTNGNKKSIQNNKGKSISVECCCCECISVHMATIFRRTVNNNSMHYTTGVLIGKKTPLFFLLALWREPTVELTLDSNSGVEDFLSFSSV